MRIVSLDPFLTELVASAGLLEQLVGVTHRCDYPPEVGERYVVTRAGSSRTSRASGQFPFTQDEVQWQTVAQLEPDVILAALPPNTRTPVTVDELKQLRLRAEEWVRSKLRTPAGLFVYAPRTLEGVFEMYEQVAADLGVPAQGTRLHHRVKAQMMSWVDNFYPRMKSKKVSVLAGVDPALVAGAWVADMIRLASGVSEILPDAQLIHEVTWTDVCNFRPDVLLIAPQAMALQPALKTFKILEQFPGWEEIPAVKRGEVYFTDGISNFYRPSARLMDSMGILVSAMAGLESGYITPRDCFFKLRWLEMQRHRI